MSAQAPNNSSTGMAIGVMICLTAALVLFWAPTPARAHKVNVFAHVEGDRVVVEGFFSGKAKAVNCVVEVIDGQGKKIHEGKTDANGLYSFALRDFPPFEGGLVIALQAGMGHKAEYTLSPSDLGVTGKESRTGGSAAGMDSKSSAEKADKIEVTAALGPGVTAANRALLAQVVAEVVSAKIEPLEKMMANQQKTLMEQKDKGPSFTEIVGGIGWIMGIVGIAAYFMSRRRMEKT